MCVSASPPPPPPPALPFPSFKLPTPLARRRPHLDELELVRLNDVENLLQLVQHQDLLGAVEVRPELEEAVNHLAQIQQRHRDTNMTQNKLRLRGVRE